MEGGGGSADEISVRVREWCQLRAPDEHLRRALAAAADTAQRAQRKYDKVPTPDTKKLNDRIMSNKCVCH